MYTARNVGHGIEAPESIRGMTATELVIYMRDHWSVDIDTNKPQNAETAYLAETFNQAADPEYWKNPFMAVDPVDPVAVEFGAIWYHGADPLRGTVDGRPVVVSPGYQCW